MGHREVTSVTGGSGGACLLYAFPLPSSSEQAGWEGKGQGGAAAGTMTLVTLGAQALGTAL